MSLQALTLYPEWAYAIAHLGKRVENRTWMRESMVGQMLAIHGGKLIGGERDIALQELASERMFRTALAAGAAIPRGLSLSSLLEQGRGIVAVARVVGFVSSRGSIAAAGSNHHVVAAGLSAWFCGPVGWVLDEVQVLPQPVPCRGAQGLWPLPPDVLAQVHAHLGAAGAAP